MPMELRPPVTLEGRFVRLVPLLPTHAEDLAAFADDPVIWRYLPYGPCTTPAAMAELVEELLRRQSLGTDLAFTVLAQETGRPIGMTRFLEIGRTDARAEIGGTWYDRDHRRTPANTEAKYLLLRYAFEAEGLHRVQLKTDLRNLPSQAAIERLGARREGVLREHLRMPDGYRRSSVLYSILASEWPTVRGRLEGLLERPFAPRGGPVTAGGTTAAASRGTP